MKDYQKIYTGIFLAFINMLLLFTFFMFVIQRSIYMTSDTKSGENLVSQFERMNLKADDGLESPFYQLDVQSKTDCVIFLGSLVSFVDLDDIGKWFHEKFKFNIFFYTYRGQLRNPGISSEKSILKDIDTFSKYLSNRKTKKIGFGHSLGCAPLLSLGVRTKFDKLFLLCPFLSSMEVVGDRLSFLCFFKYLIVDKWDNRTLIKRIQCPVYIFYTCNDKNIKYRHSITLSKLSNKTHLIKTDSFNHFDVIRVFKNISSLYI